MKNNFKKILQFPVIIILLLILMPPLGILLLGNHPNIRLGIKVCLGILLSAMLFILMAHFQIVPRTETLLEHPLDFFSYQVHDFYYASTTLNGLDQPLEAEEGFKFAQLDLSVTNQSIKTQFYASLIDQPELYTDHGVYAPDLTLSREPFGNLEPQSTTQGYLIFVLPEEEHAIRFLIADQEFIISP